MLPFVSNILPSPLAFEKLKIKLQEYNYIPAASRVYQSWYRALMEVNVWRVCEKKF
jgi:hypothetical protein